MITSEPSAPELILRRGGPHADFFAAVQFLTRIPVPAYGYAEDTLSRALFYFPVVGLGLGAGAGLLNYWLAAHLSRALAALIVLTALVLITGAIHEDGLADCADAFGSHHTRDRTLAILRDSRIGSYGAIAVTLSLGARVLLIAALPFDHALAFLIAAHTLSRWSSLPLALLAPARPDSGQGVRIAQRVTRGSIIAGTIVTLLVTFFALRGPGVFALAAALVMTGLSAAFFQRRLGGVTGDCFGATTQLVEIAVLTCGAWQL